MFKWPLRSRLRRDRNGLSSILLVLITLTTRRNPHKVWWGKLHEITCVCVYLNPIRTEGGYPSPSLPKIAPISRFSIELPWYPVTFNVYMFYVQQTIYGAHFNAKTIFCTIVKLLQRMGLWSPPPSVRLRVSIFVCKSCDTVLLTRYSARIIFICYHSANLGFLTLFRKLFPKFPNGS